jgi:radical SAM protein with 4Fe4S-binding SPASM domain
MDFRKATIAGLNHTLDTATALEVLQDLAEMDCKTVNFSGGGEPLVHVDFGTILRFSVRQGMRAWVVSNGYFIDKWLSDLTYAHHVRVSLDASNEEEHMEMHGSKPGAFEKVCENIKALCHARDKSHAHRPEVGIAYIVADANNRPNSFRSVFEFAQGAGVDFIQFRALSEEKPRRFTDDWEKLSTWLEGFARSYPKVRCFPIGKRWNDVFHQREFSKCYSAVTAAVIGANGDVAACCDRRDLVAGNVNEQSFKSIWLGARHRRMAEQIAPELCTRCLQCSYNSAVERLIVRNESLPELI